MVGSSQTASSYSAPFATRSALKVRVVEGKERFVAVLGSLRFVDSLYLAVALNLRCFSGGLGSYPQKPQD